uniref:Uncharacterized protein n=1 Tax=Anguilla anguilla TaxID=7936 RepID=A0A0E9QXI3_ANGAN
MFLVAYLRLNVNGLHCPLNHFIIGI